MVEVVADWKRFVARKTGVEWQKGFFDHRLRHDESFEEKAHYIRMNPVRAELVANPGDWPHVWSFDGRDGSPSRPPVGSGSGRDAPPVRPAGIGAEVQGRDGSPNRPQATENGRLVGTAVPAVRGRGEESGRLGEASLPMASKPDAEVRL
jgi:hypothetical protein